MDWQLHISFHLPHDRFALGWEYIGPTEDYNISTFTCYIFVITLSFDVYH